ncbi:nickel-dependent lactate racemase [Blastopirellula sp. JC732]|uniref:Nickel-dependent lactate racemase n=1 Tax=Blastopirellula sediminis TaxID=2894196 RepID=A0A9X1SJY5_9BACT|nr:nickel-dependent lactate racemase [Blastopirellula sediminis]MCC9607533.1 nickel-dependent lactate racemase [Blastopirellula sediminis]MCC9629174.1 nickel-dependent lactate racemase [Blastopirellula sediminis]
MKVKLEYGRVGLEANIPDNGNVRTLAYKDAPPLADPHAALLEVLARPNGAPPLFELAQGKKDACIVICDITRPVPNEMILRPALELLEAAGIARDKITILNATGLHRPNHGQELVEMVGQYIVDHYRIENHDGENREEHVHLGTSPNGVPIWIDRRYVEADLKITVGLIEPHFMAGFSGGRKLICPGIAHIDTIRAWHSPRFLEHENATMGCLVDNPVHIENTSIAKTAGCDFIINVVIDAHRHPLKFVAGDMIAAFEEGVEFVRSVVVDTLDKPADIVVTSSAGYPLDTTFYQSVKAMVAAAKVVKKGGTIIVAASLTEGIGSPPFTSLFSKYDNLNAFMTAILDPDCFTMDQWQLEELAKAARQAKIVMVSDGIPAERLSELFVEPAVSVEAAIESALAEHGNDASIAVIPKGPYVLAQLA